MNNLKIVNDFIINNVRTETIIHIGTQMVSDEFLPDYIEDMIIENNIDDGIWDALNIKKSNFDSIEEFIEILHVNKKYGFLISFITPTPFNINKSGYSISWKKCGAKWIYAETFEEACSKGLSWAKDWTAKKIEKYDLPD